MTAIGKYYEPIGDNEKLHVEKTDRNPTDKHGTSYFLGQLWQRIDSTESLKYQNITEIKNATIEVRNHCREKSKVIYWIQSICNPFSQAFKIEKLSSKILKKSKELDKTNAKTIKENKVNPYEFFFISDNVKKCLRDIEPTSNANNAELKNIKILAVKYQDQDELYEIPVRFDEHYQAIYILNNDECGAYKLINTTSEEFEKILTHSLHNQGAQVDIVNQIVTFYDVRESK